MECFALMETLDPLKGSQDLLVGRWSHRIKPNHKIPFNLYSQALCYSRQCIFSNHELRLALMYWAYFWNDLYVPQKRINANFCGDKGTMKFSGSPEWTRNGTLLLLNFAILAGQYFVGFYFGYLNRKHMKTGHYISRWVLFAGLYFRYLFTIAKNAIGNWRSAKAH